MRLEALPRATLKILDIHRLDLIRRLNPEQSAKEVEFGFQRPLDVAGLPEPVLLSGKGQIGRLFASLISIWTHLSRGPAQARRPQNGARSFRVILLAIVCIAEAPNPSRLGNGPRVTPCPPHWQDLRIAGGTRAVDDGRRMRRQQPLIGCCLYLVSFHSSESGPGHLSDTSSAMRRLLDRMVSSSQEG